MTDEHKDRLRLLVVALRSGEYTQALGHLRTRDGYCCLGVACDIYRKETGEGTWIQEGATYTFLRYDTFLPHEVEAWYGIWGIMLDAGTMVNLNDDLRWNFDQIADELEKTYEL